MSTAYIAFGGNLGEVAAAFSRARNALDALPGTRVSASSLRYRTPPLGPEGQATYLNAAVSLHTHLDPLSLLAHLQKIERMAGRKRSIRWGPRTLDLDLIAYDALVMDTPMLTLPHPRVHERQFVLRPLCDIAPNWQHPLLARRADMLLADLLQAGEPPLPAGEPW